MKTMLIVFDDPVQLEQRRIEDASHLTRGLPVTGTFLDGKLIARCAGEPDPQLTSEPRRIVYVGRVLCRKHGIRAALCVLLPKASSPADSEPDSPELEMVLLGNVVRVPQDLKGLDRESEFLDHFKEVMTGNAAPKIDRILPHL